MTEDKDRAVHEAAKQALDSDLDTLDLNVTARLSAARRQAIDALPDRHCRRTSMGWAVAATLVVAVSLWWMQAADDAGMNAEDFEMLVTGEGLELYEDLEFYDWLASEYEAG